jgi:hypothetical protein
MFQICLRLGAKLLRYKLSCVGAAAAYAEALAAYAGATAAKAVTAKIRLTQHS